MSKSYKVVKKTMNMGEKKGETIYSVRPVSYGTISTDEVAKQISQESTATSADVKAVLDRYAYYVIANLRKGYSIELLGFGTLYLRFIIDKAVDDKSKANANLVKSIVPAFRPSFTVDHNGKRTYDLIPERISLVKYGEEKSEDNSPTDTEGDNDENTDNTPSGDSTSGGGTASGGSTTGDDSTSEEGDGGGTGM